MSKAIESWIATHMMTIHKATPVATGWQETKAGPRICMFKGEQTWIVIYDPSNLKKFCLYQHRRDLCQRL